MAAFPTWAEYLATHKKQASTPAGRRALHDVYMAAKQRRQEATDNADKERASRQAAADAAQPRLARTEDAPAFVPGTLDAQAHEELADRNTMFTQRMAGFQRALDAAAAEANAGYLSSAQRLVEDMRAARNNAAARGATRSGIRVYNEERGRVADQQRQGAISRGLQDALRTWQTNAGGEQAAYGTDVNTIRRLGGTRALDTFRETVGTQAPRHFDQYGNPFDPSAPRVNAPPVAPATPTPARPAAPRDSTGARVPRTSSYGTSRGTTPGASMPPGWVPPPLRSTRPRVRPRVRP